MLLILLCFAALAASSPSSFVRYRNKPELARARLHQSMAERLHQSKEKALQSRGVIGCQACVDFLDADENTIINIILQVGVEGTCEDVCGKLPSSIEQNVCTLLCLVVGMEKFVNALSNDDLDPIYVCAELKSCKNNTCSGPCTSITSASFSPAVARLRSKFYANIQVKANQETGVGVTAITWPCTSAQCQDPQNQLEVVNDGYTAGSSTNVKFEINTAEQEWMFPLGTSPVTVFSCGSDCNNPHGTIFSNAYSNFTITH